MIALMTCVFCKTASDSSRSEEHVVPESLGNLDYVLPRGVVCDACNNYFATKIEGPLLNLFYFRDLCHRAAIKNKKGNSPRIKGFHVQSRVVVDLFADTGGGGSLAASRPQDEALFADAIRALEGGTILVPVPVEPDEWLMSRFLAKVAIGCAALRLIGGGGAIADMLADAAFDPLRQYARRGTGASLWPYHARRLYAPDRLFEDAGSEPYTIAHEWTFLLISDSELIFVLALFGVEYAVNVGWPDTSPYLDWLRKNADRSPLYPEGI